jgi:hypothetical protein
MVPPPGDAWVRAVEVERERRVAGDVFCKKGHRDLDWRRTASMMATWLEIAIGVLFTVQKSITVSAAKW